MREMEPLDRTNALFRREAEQMLLAAQRQRVNDETTRARLAAVRANNAVLMLRLRRRIADAETSETGSDPC